jgi:hypothetical protein
VSKQKGQQSDTLSRIFIPICKIDEENRLVYGKMTFEAEDSSGEIWDYDGSKPYFEKWSENAEKTSGGKSLGNLRSMHQPIAAGKLTQFIMDDENKSVEIAAKVVDDGEWGKVLEGVYTGFSQGGRYVKRWKDPDDNTKTRYISDPVEVSLVDLPCLPGATFEYVKADGSVELRKFNKETVMDPTNEEIAARATEMAKAAGDATKWADHLGAARDALIAEKVGNSSAAPAPAESASEDGAVSTEIEASPAGGEGDAEKTATGDPAPVGGEPVEDTDVGGEGAGGELEVDAEKARKAARERLSQVWKTTDGQTFAKCDEAVAHEATIDAPPAVALTPVEAALKAAAGEDAPAEETQVEKFTPTEGLDVAVGTLDTLVAKGLYSARESLCVLQSVISLQSDAAWEADYEGDNSPIPGQLADIARSLGDAALAMCKEEIAEALANLPEEQVVEIFVENAAQGDLAKTVLGDEELVAKVGARNSKKDAASVQKIHDETVELGAECPTPEEAEKALEPDALQKRAEKDPVVKHLLEKNTELESEVTKALDGIADLGKQITALKAQPAPMAPRTHVIGKSADNGGADDVDLAKAETLITELQKTEAGRRTLAEAALRASMSAGGHKA